MSDIQRVVIEDLRDYIDKKLKLQAEVDEMVLREGTRLDADMRAMVSSRHRLVTKIIEDLEGIIAGRGTP